MAQGSVPICNYAMGDAQRPSSFGHEKAGYTFFLYL